MKKSLNGSADFVFTDGAINGVNVARMIREAYARIKGTKLPPEDAEQKTDFSEVRGSVHVSKGIATNNDFTMRTPLLRVNGKGTANLPAETVDYRVRATLVSTLKGQGGEELGDGGGLLGHGHRVLRPPMIVKPSRPPRGASPVRTRARLAARNDR